MEEQEQNFKTAYCYKESGAYVSAVAVKEDEMEPGVFNMPPNSTDQMPAFAELPMGWWPYWNGSQWELQVKKMDDALLKQANEERARAYKDESDPLFFKWQRNEGTKQEWLDKIEEIKRRYPDPVEPV